MCGICIVVFSREANINQFQGENVYCHTRLGHRGPDGRASTQKRLTNQHTALFHGCALQFQGPLTVQPIHGRHGNMLLWNGEVFGGLEIADKNDGVKLCDVLDSCDSDLSVLQTLVSIRGPWAFIYWKEEKQQLWFGRDVFGRRSLVFHQSEHLFSLCSVTVNTLDCWEELPAEGVYCMQYSDVGRPQCTLYPWKHKVFSCTEGQKHTTDGIIHESTGHVLSDDQSKSSVESSSACVTGDSLKTVNCTQTADLPVCCSEEKVNEYGGHSTPESSKLDKQLSDPSFDIVAITHSVDEKMSLSEKLNRLNVTLGDYALPSCIDRFNRDNPTTDVLHKSKAEITEKNITSDMLLRLADQCDLDLAKTLIEALSQAVKVRVKCQASKCHRCFLPDHHLSTSHKINETLLSSKFAEDFSDVSTSVTADISDRNQLCGHARVAVMFSGGIDSLVIAALADRHVPAGEPIDLMNVAFEQKRNNTTSNKKRKKVNPHQGNGTDLPAEKLGGSYDVPDRETGKSGLLQLQQLNKDRQWNFIEVNVTYEELKEAREAHVRELLYPLQTVLDDSIGCAAWFAARGQGHIVTSEDFRKPYTSTARVVLVGMGADEQLAGYSRHRVQFNTGGWENLVSEIEMEIKRISVRNLGRDDRIISDHSKEARFPFLDENVVQFLSSIPVCRKANLHLPRGAGEKFLLRVAAATIGLTGGAVLPKRAIQFGSRIAKMENANEKASDICERLQHMQT